MNLNDLDFTYPDSLVALEPKRPSRVLWVDDKIQEVPWGQALERIPAGDVLVVNNTRVLKRRVFSGETEILFLNNIKENLWQVLFPASQYAIGDRIELPEGQHITLKEKGRPQIVEADNALDETYFERVGELPLPPYIQKLRATRHAKNPDEKWYQTAWADQPGSLAAPTASLHFSQSDLAQLKSRGVKVVEITLHVGLGTFLPVTASTLENHKMHSEPVSVSRDVWNTVTLARQNNQKIWAMGTTVARALESVSAGLLKNTEANFEGESDLFITPGFQWQVVDRLLTNFHQPKSTLLALVCAFSNSEKVKTAYNLAIENNFRLFSYGDLSIWMRE